MPAVVAGASYPLTTRQGICEEWTSVKRAPRRAGACELAGPAFSRFLIHRSGPPGRGCDL